MQCIASGSRVLKLSSIVPPRFKYYALTVLPRNRHVHHSPATLARSSITGSLTTNGGAAHAGRLRVNTKAGHAMDLKGFELHPLTL